MFESVGYQTIHLMHVDVPNWIRIQPATRATDKGPKIASQAISEHQIWFSKGPPSCCVLTHAVTYSAGPIQLCFRRAWGCVVTSSHSSNHYCATILRGVLNEICLLVRQTPHASDNPTVAFLSCTGRLTAITSSLYNIKLKLNTCSVPRSELVE